MVRCEHTYTVFNVDIASSHKLQGEHNTLWYVEVREGGRAAGRTAKRRVGRTMQDALMARTLHLTAECLTVAGHANGNDPAAYSPTAHGKDPSANFSVAEYLQYIFFARPS